MSHDYESLRNAAVAVRLDILGAFDAAPDDGLPEGTGTVLLLGPHEPGFWAHVTAEPEFHDDKPDPLDRWSRRVIGRLACDHGAKAYFPFTGPPFRPFIRWALRSGRAWQSPVGLLVHDVAGLMVSYRGVIALRETIACPPHPTRPCDACAGKPCLDACPAHAITSGTYDIGLCRTYLAENRGSPCMTAGCLVRRACPVSQGYARQPEQSAYHMRQFLG